MVKDQVSSTTGHATAIKSLGEGVFMTLHSRLDRGGALQARKLASGAVQLYWRYPRAGKTHREPIGVYDSSAPPKKLQPTARGYSITAALEKCRALADIHVERADTGGLQAAKAETRQTLRFRRSSPRARWTSCWRPTWRTCRPRAGAATWTPSRSSSAT